MTQPVSGRQPVLALLMRLLLAAVLVLPAFGAQAGAIFTSLYSFGSVQDTNGNILDGANPDAPLVQGSDGYFYGTTPSGGTNGYGTVFKISTNGALTSLYSFTGGNDGGNPTAGLVQGSDGNYYGTTQWGGTNDYGTVFKINTNGALTTIYAFGTVTDAYGDRLDGAYPEAGLVQGTDGNFYGTTQWGGTNDYGTVFKINTNGALTSLYSFDTDNGTNGANPQAALVQGSDGNFYGTTSGGGVYTNQYGQGYGTVFRLTIVPSPQLTLIPFGPYVILTWPTNAFVFNLESSTGIGSWANWNTNSLVPVVIGGQNVVISPISGTQMYFRLLLAP
jgi:uncharacterized repeat protein (TIGR03803 family)